MPMYLVRWPDLSAALVSASNEDVLVDILDEVANPEGCTWSVYRGPIFIEFQLNAELNVVREEGAADRPLEPRDLRLGDVSGICERDTLTVVIPESDTAADMVAAVTRAAFPSVHAALNAAGEEASEADVRAAVEKEVDVLMRASWQQHQTKRRPDEVSRIAAAMGTAPQWVEYMRQPVEDTEPPSTPDPTTPTRKPRRGKKR